MLSLIGGELEGINCYSNLSISIKLPLEILLKLLNHLDELRPLQMSDILLYSNGPNATPLNKIIHQLYARNLPKIENKLTDFNEGLLLKLPLPSEHPQ